MFSVLSSATEARSTGSTRVCGIGWLKYRGEGGGFVMLLRPHPLINAGSIYNRNCAID